MRAVDGRRYRGGRAEPEPVLTAAALVVAGAVWMLAVALFNIGVQLSAPRWVAGRSLAAFQASMPAASRSEAGAGDV